MYTTDRLFSTRSLMLNGDIAIQSSEHGERFCRPMVAKESMLLLVMRGTISVRHGNVSYTAPKNSLVFLRKDIFVECSGGSRAGHVEQTDFVAVYLKDDLLRDFIKTVRISILSSELPTAVVTGPMGERLVKFVESLEAYFADGPATAEYLVRIKLLELLFNLANTNRRICTQLLMSLRVQFKADLASTVEENLMTPKSLIQLAELCGRSLSSFKRDFSAIYNLPPSTWVRQRRLEKARELLTSTTMTVTDVCYTLGFESVAHFSRLFKSTFGCPPSKSRISVARE